jgi:hypothetical protein
MRSEESQGSQQHQTDLSLKKVVGMSSGSKSIEYLFLEYVFYWTELCEF